MHLVRQPDCRSGEGSSILLGGAFEWGDGSTWVEHCPRTAEIGVRIPVIPRIAVVVQRQNSSVPYSRWEFDSPSPRSCTRIASGSGSQTLNLVTRVRFPPGAQIRRGGELLTRPLFLLPVLAARRRFTNPTGEVRLLAGRPCPRPAGLAGASLRSSTFQVRLLARVCANSSGCGSTW